MEASVANHESADISTTRGSVGTTITASVKPPTIRTIHSSQELTSTNNEDPRLPAACFRDQPNTPLTKHVARDAFWPIPGSPDWSSAIGKAAAAGKSGRVIERLMNDCDILRREKKLAIVKCEEETRRGESARSALEALRLSNDNLSSLHESDSALLTKRDRRLRQLREDLEHERHRREMADQQTQETRKERDDMVSSLKTKSMEDKQNYQRVNAQYDILSSSWKALESQYKSRLDQIQQKMDCLITETGEDREKLLRMDSLLDRSIREMEKCQWAICAMQRSCEAFTTRHTAALETMKDHATASLDDNALLYREMTSALHDLKWALGLTKAMRSHEGPSIA